MRQVFRPRCSLLLLFLLFLIHCLAIFFVCLMAIHQFWLYLLLPLIFLSFIYYYRYAQLALNNSVVQFGEFSRGRWFIVTASRGILSVSVAESSVLTRYISVLHFKTQTGCRYFCLLLFPDSLPPQQQRQLRISLALYNRKQEKF